MTTHLIVSLKLFGSTASPPAPAATPVVVLKGQFQSGKVRSWSPVGYYRLGQAYPRSFARQDYPQRQGTRVIGIPAAEVAASMYILDQPLTHWWRR